MKQSDKSGALRESRFLGLKLNYSVLTPEFIGNFLIFLLLCQFATALMIVYLLVRYG